MTEKAKLNLYLSKNAISMLYNHYGGPIVSIK